jgi:Flp pilus assembly protein TadD
MGCQGSERANFQCRIASGLQGAGGEGKGWGVADRGLPEGGDRLTALVGLALVAATLAVFGPACANQFINYDDPQYVTDNPNVLAGLSRESTRWALTSTEVFNWHPLTWISLQLDCTLYRLRPWGYHLTNVLLHAANTLLLFLALRRLTGVVWPSALVAALFAVHPLHVESVAWVAERKDVLSTFFGLLALAAYARYVERPGLGRYLVVALALALSLMAKPMLVTLPALFLLLDYWPLGRLRFGQSVAARTIPAAPAALALVLGEKLPLFILAAASSLLTVIAQHQGGAMQSLGAIPLNQRAGNAVVSYLRYLGQALWPGGLAPFYPHPLGTLPAWQVAAAAGLLVGITALVLAVARRRPYLAVGWLWYLGTLVPVIGLVQAGYQGWADRYTYVPLIGVFVMLAWGLADLVAWRPVLRGKLVLAIAVALLACAVLTVRQIGFWHDSRSLWEQALRVTDNNYLAETNVGVLAMDSAPEKAEEHLRSAVRINPDYPRPYLSLGLLLERQGRIDDAISCYAQSLEKDPHQPGTRSVLAMALWKQGKLEEAIGQLSEATRLGPEVAEAHYHLAFALVRAGRLEEAVVACRRCVQLQPRNRKYRQELANLLREQGDVEGAAAESREAERLGGGNP